MNRPSIATLMYTYRLRGVPLLPSSIWSSIFLRFCMIEMTLDELYACWVKGNRIWECIGEPSA